MAATIPLCIDLDGTLIRSDLLHESTLKLLRDRPHLIGMLPWWLLSGKARLKREIAHRVDLDVHTLPFDERFLDWVKSERARGRHIVLCTASDRKYAEAVARHLGVIDEVIATDGETNLSAQRKAAALVARFGAKGFDYAGNSRADLDVWAAARRAIVVSAPSGIAQAARAQFDIEQEFARAQGGVRAWLRALRLHQWLKNLLLFVPLIGAHQLANVSLLPAALLAFVAFSLCASGIYVLNDLVDLESDRKHPRKRLRPFASGALSALHGAIAAPLALALAFIAASFVNTGFVAWLALYALLTLAYSFGVKRVPLLDCLVLAGLYTLRIISGGAAVGLGVSFWLLAFSLFLFLSLAYVKRFSELRVMESAGHTVAHGRGYRTGDERLLETMGVVAGFAAVLVMALYINSDAVTLLYGRVEVLWLTIPILLFWVSRMWLTAHRGDMHDDPVLFAVRDPASLLCGALFLGVIWAAM